MRTTGTGGKPTCKPRCLIQICRNQSRKVEIDLLKWVVNISMGNCYSVSRCTSPATVPSAKMKGPNTFCLEGAQKIVKQVCPLPVFI